MNKGLEALERLHEFAWSNEEYRNDIDNTDYQIIEKELKDKEQLEKAFDTLSKDDEKTKELLSLEIEKNRALEILRECNLTIDEFNKKFDFISGKVPKDKVDFLRKVLL